VTSGESRPRSNNHTGKILGAGGTSPQILDEGGNIHTGKILGAGGTSPHILDEGGNIHTGKILGAGGKSPHILDEGGNNHTGKILGAGGKSPQILDEGGIVSVRLEKKKVRDQKNQFELYVIGSYLRSEKNAKAGRYDCARSHRAVER
jgi:hypothetical protein